MRAKIIWILLHGAVLLIPLLELSIERGSSAPSSSGFPGFPTSLDGQPLEQLALSKQQQVFLKDFPGEVGRFRNGSREIIIRWLYKESRRLHPASDCYKGMGYAVHPAPLRKDFDGQYWSCFRAIKEDQSFFVCEQIYDDFENSWSDVSSWYWAAVLNKTAGPWWAVTIAEEELL